MQVILGKLFPDLAQEESSMAGFSKTQLLCPHCTYVCAGLSHVFGDRLIRSDIWPACSPDLLGMFEGQSLQQ
jgi:hypothetical protein